MRTLTAYRTQPTHSREERHDDLNVVLYIGDNPKPFAKAYSGKRNRPDFYYTFANSAQRDRHIEQYLAGLRRDREDKARRRLERSAYQHRLQVDDILVHQWGWEQTNIDFYQVVAVKGKKVVVRAIAAASVDGEDGFMTDRCLPCRGQFTGPELLKTPYGYADGRDYLSFEFGCCGKWDGTPQRRSWYG